MSDREAFERWCNANFAPCSRHCPLGEGCALQEEREAENILAALEYIKQSVRDNRF